MGDQNTQNQQGEQNQQNKQNPQGNPPAAPPPAPAPGNTPPAAGNADVEALAQKAAEKAAEAAEKKMAGVFRSMLLQNGLDPETVNQMTEDWKAKQQTPEQAMEAVRAEVAKEKGRAEKAEAEKEKMERRFMAVGKGVPADKAEKYVALAASYPEAETDFAKAMDAALADFPVASPAPPPFPGAAGTGGAALLGGAEKTARDSIRERMFPTKKG